MDVISAAIKKRPKTKRKKKKRKVQITKVTKGKITIAFIVAVAACGPPPLENTYRSPEDLARAVLDALARRDQAALGALALSEREFRAHVWPSLPAARPERNLPFSYVWGDLAQKSAIFLTATVATHGHRRYQLLKLRFEEPAADFRVFRVHAGAVLVIREGTGPPQDLRLCGSFLETAQGWKVFSYVIDD